MGKAILILAAVLVLSGCESKSDMVVAKVGDKKITIRDLNKALEKIPKAYKPKGETDEEIKRGYLQTLVDKELLLMEARSRGYDKDLAGKVATKKRQLVEAELHRREIRSKIDSVITKKEILDFFRNSNYRKRVRISMIGVSTKQEADRVMERISEGEKFEDIARNVSIYKRSRELGGDVGWQTWSIGIQPYQKEAFNSKVGSIIGPAQSNYGFQIIKVTDIADTDFEKLDPETKQEIEGQCYRQKRMKRETEYISNLRKKYHLKVKDDVVQLIISKIVEHRKFNANAFSEDEKNLTLIRYGKNRKTVEDYLDFILKMSRIRNFTPPRDSTYAARSIDYFINFGVLVPAEIERLKLDEKEPVKSKIKQFEDEQITERIRTIEARDKVKITDDMVRDYFERNRDTFRVLASFRIQEILVQTKQEADSLKKLIENGADMGELSKKHSLRPDIPRNNRGIAIFNPGNLEYGDLTEEVKKAELLKLTGPVKANKGYSIFRVIEKKDEVYQEFDDVKQKATNYVKSELTEKYFEELLEKLREKYADIVTVYDNALKYWDPEMEPKRS